MVTNTLHPASRPARLMHAYSAARKQEVRNRLRELGADYYDMLLPETKALPGILAEDERLEGVVYGRYHINKGPNVSRGLLAITDRRILLIDKKPLFLRYDDLSFVIVSGILYGQSALCEEVTLATRMGDVSFRTFNRACASQFARAVDQMLFATGTTGSDQARRDNTLPPSPGT